MGFFMLFVRLGQIAAWLLLINGVLMVTISLGFATWGDQAAFQQYFPGKSTGKSIDAGFRYIGISIGFGIASHIAATLFLILERRDQE
jgi:heme/copper-type cytochrome/quinol oxidase subunit 1